ncbi:MAG: VOC family protein [Rhodobacteraceae bacterium]|nr:VOC family protein [Paracoccaceae bacterium]
MITSAIPVLRIADYPRARSFWTEVLEFEVIEEGGDPARFGILIRDGQRVFLDAWHGADAEPSPGWRVYCHTNDVDGLAKTLAARDCALEGPRDAPYGMREIEVIDPDGNRICFGMDI